MTALEYADQLARTYKEKAEVSGKWRDYLQAHGLANFCVTQEPTDDRRRLVYEIEESWYQGDHPLSYDEHQQLISDHKQLLEKYREDTRNHFGSLETSACELNSDDIFSKENLKNADVFCSQVFTASKTCSEGLISVSKKILQSSVEVLKRKHQKAPGKFAIIGLGSIAKGDATPYSDLEYAIIIEKKSDYFERLAVGSYFRIGNLGESPLKTFDIEELKTNSEPVKKLRQLEKRMTTGYRIDGITKNSGNIPTGNGKEDGLCLMLTIEQLMELYKKEAEKPFDGFAGDKSDMLSSTVVLLSNGQMLYEQFVLAKQSYENCIGEVVRKKRLDSFACDIEKYTFLPEFAKFQPPDNLNVKVKEKIFRYPTLLANNLKMCLGLTATRSLEIYSEINNQGLLSSDNLQHLNIILALSIYIRTSAYLKGKSQTEFVQVNKYYKSGQVLSYAVPAHLVVIMGCLLTPIKQSIKSRMLKPNSSADTKEQSFTDISSLLQELHVPHRDLWLKSEALYFTGQYDEAKKEISNAIGQPITTTSFSKLCEIIHNATKLPGHSSISSASFRKRLQLCAYLLYYTHDYKLALECFRYFFKNQCEESFQMGLWKLLAAHCSAVISDYRAAQQLLREGEKYLELSGVAAAGGKEISHRDTSSTYTNIGSVYRALSEYKKALEYFTKALNIDKDIHGDTNDTDIARDISCIGSVYLRLGDYRLALEYSTTALHMQKAIYGKEANHDDIARSYNNISLTYCSLGDYRLALEYLANALDMQKAIYGEETNHDHIAISYNNIGLAYSSLGDYKLALEYHTKALDMQKAIYREETNHDNIARSYNNIGLVYSSLGDYKLALEYHTKALVMQKAIYGEDTNQNDIATSYNNIGTTYSSSGDYRQALEYYTKALDMKKAVYGEETNHRDIATSYNNIGTTYSSSGDYSLALEYHAKALDIQKAIYGEDTNHDDIASSYNNIGSVHFLMGWFQLALEYFSKGINVSQAIHGKNSSHPEIAKAEFMVQMIRSCLPNARLRSLHDGSNSPEAETHCEVD